MNLRQLKDCVLQQWLVGDLKDIGEPSLPNNLTQLKSTQLNANYTLQVSLTLISLIKIK